MPTVNYLQVIDYEHDAANRNKNYRRLPKWQNEAHGGLPIYQSIEITLQR